jgi:hypothetical protein
MVALRRIPGLGLCAVEGSNPSGRRGSRLDSFGTATRLGYSAPVSTAVKDLTGRDPRPAADAVG